MKLDFLGACRQVGRSQFEVRTEGLGLLLDAGSSSFEGARFPLQPVSPADAVILTHAHLDHSGGLPLLYRKRNIPFYCTFPTLPLCNLLWEDALKVAQKRGESPYISPKEISGANHHCVCMPYEEPYEFFNGTRFSLHDAGHIPGSAQILIEDSGKKLLYSGDVNSEESRLQHAAGPPETDVDALVVESTYANREHPPRKDVEADLIEAVEEALQDGNALIPCFAIGRTQELLMVLNSSGIGAQIYVDGMGIASSNVITEYPSYVKNPGALASAMQRAHFIEDHSQRRKVAASTGKVIVATAGMLDGGPALTYLEKMNQSGKGAVLLTGYQVEGTNGRLLVEKGQVRDRGRTVKVNLPVKAFDFSAHSGRKPLVEYIKKANPGRVYCVHGDEAACTSFARELKEQEGISAFAPQAGDTVAV